MRKILLSALLLSVVAVTRADVTIHPIIDAQYGYLLGASSDGRWLNDKVAAKQLHGGEPLRIWGTQSLLGNADAGKPHTDEAPCGETQWVQPSRNFGNGVFAIGGRWNALPRKPRFQSTSNRFYRAEVERILKQAGIKKPKVVLSQLWRIDLDGDGRDEVLFSATNYGGTKAGPMQISSNARSGEYSVVLLRTLVNGRVQTVSLAKEIYTRNQTFAAPNEHRIGAVLDANGDGKMEIVLRSRYYEGDAVSLLEFNNSKVREVLSAGCGA
jgi:hypothetical protein